MVPALLKTLATGTRLRLVKSCPRNIGKVVILQKSDPAGDFAYCTFERTGEGATFMADQLECDAEE